MTGSDAEERAEATKGSPGLEGYLYQLDASIWIALDFVMAKGVAHLMVLEPIGQEDLEAPLSEDDPGAILSTAPLAGRQLVVQAKLRETGVWSLKALANLLKHGKRRESAAARLERDRDTAFLLVTSVDASKEAQALRLKSLTARGWSTDLPTSLAKLIPNSAGRFAILATEDPWKLDQHLRRLLEEAFRVPRARLDECLAALRDAALQRMRGLAAGRWTRNEIAAILKAHDGRLARTAEREAFVPPTNWPDIRAAMTQNNAIILTGTSGTGKTTAARVLADVLRDETPGLSIIPIDQGPEQVRRDQTVGPVVFLIDDPWGHYRFEPNARPWNDELGRLLETATPNRRFIITSRTDVLRESQARPLAQKWYAQLEAENYGLPQRVRLFENRLPSLAPALQLLAESGRRDILTELLSPLEMQKFFDLLGEGNRTEAPDHVFLSNCIRDAHESSIENTVIQQVEAREATSAAAILWGLLKARPKQSRDVIQHIEAGLARRDPALEDTLDPFINLFVAARHLRQDDKWISYYHPRIEKALESAIKLKPQRTRRLLELLVNVLVGLDGDGADDWGRESAALLLAAIAETPGLSAQASQDAQARLDAWLQGRLQTEGEDFRRILKAAAAIGRQPFAEVARWLVHKDLSKGIFMSRWIPVPDDEAWYAARRAEPLTAKLCDRFVRDVLPYDHDGYPEGFPDHIERLAPDLTDAFLEAAGKIVGHGVNHNSEAVVRGALGDLDGFAAVAQSAMDLLDKTHSDDAMHLAALNGEYSDDYIQHLGESEAEDAYTADELVKAYVQAVRDQRGWPALEPLASRDGFLGYWARSLWRTEAPPSEDEVIALARHATGSPHEDRVWWIARDHWIARLETPLSDRLRAGSPHPDVRRAAASCAARQRPGALVKLAVVLATEAPDRLTELVSDLTDGTPLGEREPGPDLEVLEAIYAALPVEIAEALRALAREDPDSGGALSLEAQAWLSARDPGPNVPLRLRIAQALAASGAVVADHVHALLAADAGVDASDRNAAVWAAEEAARRDDVETLRACLQHRFADVRQSALIALAARSDGPLAVDLLALATDKGARVRKALLDLLDARRRPEHIATLSEMAGDTWNASSGFYGEDASYPISRRASEILATSPDVPEAVLQRAADLAPPMKDDKARDGLLKVLAAGGAFGQGKLMALATDRGNIFVATAAASALLTSPAQVDPALLTPITTQELLTRHAMVAVELALLVGLRGAPDHVRTAAEAVAAHPRRSALIVPLIVGSAERTDGAREIVAGLAAPGKAEAVVAASYAEHTLPRETVQVGDPRIGDRILRRLAFLFATAAP